MTYARPIPGGDSETLPRTPSRITTGRGETPEDVAFLSGVALSHLHLVVSGGDVPQTLLREHLVLNAIWA